MINNFQDPVFNILLNSGYRLITIFPHPEVILHYIYEDVRTEDGELSLTGFSVTEFLNLNRGVSDNATALALLTNYLERNKLVAIKFKMIPYITHSTI